MLKNICNVWKTSKSEFGIMLIVLLASGVLGMFLMPILIYMDVEMPYIAFGTLIAVFLWLLINFILGLFGYQNNFDLIVSMGCRRKDFIISQIVVVYINLLLELGVVGLVYVLEKMLYQVVYSSYEMFDITVYILKPKIMLVLFLLIPAFRLLIGAFVLKYKKKAFWIIWAIWMLGSFGSGRLIPYLAHHPKNWLWQCVLSMINLPGSVQMLMVLLLTIVMLSGTYLLTRKQAVYV